MTATAVNFRQSVNPTRPDGRPVSRWDGLSGPFIGSGVVVRAKRPEDAVVSNFSPAQWHNIFSDIRSDAALNHFLACDAGCCRAYILSDISGDSFGWIMLRRRDDVLCDSVEFHGGAWRHGLHYDMAKFSASCLVINAALRLHIRVTSRCYRTNKPALRFLENIGFAIVRRSSSRPWFYLVLSRERFNSSPVVNRTLNQRPVHSIASGQ